MLRPFLWFTCGDPPGWELALTVTEVTSTPVNTTPIYRIVNRLLIDFGLRAKMPA